MNFINRFICFFILQGHFTFLDHLTLRVKRMCVYWWIVIVLTNISIMGSYYLPSCYTGNNSPRNDRSQNMALFRDHRGGSIPHPSHFHWKLFLLKALTPLSPPPPFSFNSSYFYILQHFEYNKIGRADDKLCI